MTYSGFMSLDPTAEHQLRMREATQLWLSHEPFLGTSSWDEVAVTAGLEPLGRGWVTLDAAQAHEWLVALLHMDMAHGRQLMPMHRAQWLATKFLGSFGTYGVHYATNSDTPFSSDAVSYTQATGYTFDSGIAVLGAAHRGLFWVAEEV